MFSVLRTRSWCVVLLAGIIAAATFLVCGCSEEISMPQDGDSSVSLADKAKPESFTGDVVMAPNIWDAPWQLQGLKKARNVKESGTGPLTIEDLTAGDYEVSWGAVDGFWVPIPASETGKLPFNQTLTFSTIYKPFKATSLTHYEQNFENLLQAPYWMGGDGWLVYGNVFDGENWLYGYGPEPAPNNLEDPAWCDIVTGQGGELQEIQQLVAYSDYANEDHGNGYTIESNLFQEQDIQAGAAGTWYFSFDAKMGNLIESTGATAAAFIKTLNPNDGWAMTNFITADMTSISDLWTRYELSIDVTGLDGQVLQFGFLNTATDYEASGIYYDNVVFADYSTLP